LFYWPPSLPKIATGFALAGQLSRQRRSIGYFLLIANWEVLDFDRPRAALDSGYLDQSLRRLSSFPMQIGIRLVHLLTPFLFIQSIDERACAIWTIGPKKF
jgi:hypothetical protein